LWQVDEKTSAEVIENFYGYIADGMPKNTALRRAKLDFMAAHPGELSAPFYWSGMVLIGDGAPVSATGQISLWYWIGLAILIVLSVLAYGQRHRRGRRRS
ncbi:MAG: CHAT domain-containing protein, partial [Cryomorphaceae bacterium]|nr:CHAT domain-containing protein [Flavobacteriales bacterium]